MARLRLGIADTLDGRPLAWGFLRGHHNDLFDARLVPPSRVSELLRLGELDAGLLPSPHLVGLDDVVLVPDLCVSTGTGADAPRLLSTVPPDQVRRVAIDLEPSGGACLLELVYRGRFGYVPELVPQRGRVEEVPAGFDAALLVAESALRASWSVPHGLRMSEMWNELTGVAWVSAVWAVRRQVASPDLTFYFKSSLRYGLSSLEIMARELGTEKGVRTRRVRRYLGEQLSYVLGDGELVGLTRLVEEHGRNLAQSPPELVFL